MHIKNILFSIFIISVVFSQNEYQEWNDGPYGTEFYDIAAPFTFYDLNPLWFLLIMRSFGH